MISPRTCPICNRELPADVSGESGVFPFCSLRCKQVDLYHWFNGDYAIEEVLVREGGDAGAAELEEDVGTEKRRDKRKESFDGQG